MKIPDEVVFLGWAAGGRLVDLAKRGPTPATPFSIEKAREQYAEHGFKPAATEFARCIAEYVEARLAKKSPKRNKAKGGK